MDNSNRDFYLSGLISLALFSLCASLFVAILFQSSKADRFGMKKDNYISISLEASKMQTSTQKKQTIAKVVSKVTPKVSKDVDINHLFSKVWTKKIALKSDKPKPMENKRVLALKQEIQTFKVDEAQERGKSNNDVESVKRNQKSKATPTAEQVNEYLAKIQAVVYRYFHVPPNSEGSSVKTVIELNALGRVIDFRVLEYSNNDALNHEVDQMKDRLKNVIFPINPQNRSTRTVVVLISKESK